MFWFKKTNREISTARGEVIYLFFQKFILKLAVEISLFVFLKPKHIITKNII